MALLYQTRKFEHAVLKQVQFKYPGLMVCELGNQEVREGQLKYPAKLYYGHKGAIHMSIDLNGEDGAYQHDLREPIHYVYHSRFDVVTDYGTLEHVEDQYEAWVNVHRLCRLDGIMLHVLPYENYYKGHCSYYYNEDIMRNLADAFGWEVIQLKVITRSKKRHEVAAAFRKKRGYFPGPKRFAKAGIVVSTDEHRSYNYA